MIILNQYYVMDIPNTIPIEGIEIDLVENYTYLCTVFDHRLCFQTNTDAISKKVQQRLYFLRIFFFKGVHQNDSDSGFIELLFYRTFIESVLTFCVVVWVSESG